MARRRAVDTAAGRAHYLAVGQGPPVALLHGLDGSARWWTPTIRALAPHYRCYALDFVRFDRWRERGRVPLPRAAAFVAAWLEALGLDRAHLLAHSMGAYPALALAAERPELLGRLVLVAPAIGAGLPSSPREVARWLSFPGAVAPRFAPVL